MLLAPALVLIQLHSLQASLSVIRPLSLSSLSNKYVFLRGYEVKTGSRPKD